jgi:hypothetical protein
MVLENIAHWRNVLRRKAVPHAGTVQGWNETITHMARSPKERFCVFSHIPKTAGITLALIMARNYEPNALLHIVAQDRELAAELKKTEVLRKRIIAIAGHFHLNSEVYDLTPQNYIHFTLLRDPVERVVSFYFFLRQEALDPLNKKINANHMSLRDVVHGGLVGELNNGQSRRLAHMHPRYGHCPPEVLEIAKKNLMKYFTFFGLTEQFDETLVVLRMLLGWADPFYVSSNVTPRKPALENIDQADIDCIIEYNELDIALYAYAKEIFNERLSQLGPRFKAEYDIFRSLNKVFQEKHHEFHQKIRALDHPYPWPNALSPDWVARESPVSLKR